MTKENEEHPEEIWKNFLRKHWKIFLLIAGGIICAVIGAIYVFLWRTTGPEAIAQYPQTLDLWTVGYIITLILDVILWEFLIIGIPVIAVAVLIILLWWNKLPAEEKQEYSRSPKGKGSQKKVSRGRGSGIFGFLITITWLIIIYLDGYWNTAFGLWNYTYLIYSVLAALLWDLLIVGIPLTIFLIWWLRRELKK